MCVSVFHLGLLTGKVDHIFSKLIVWDGFDLFFFVVIFHSFPQPNCALASSLCVPVVEHEQNETPNRPAQNRYPAFTIPPRAKRHTDLADEKQIIEDVRDERETIAPRYRWTGKKPTMD